MILRENLHLRKISSKWVSQTHSEVEKLARYVIYRDHLARHQQERYHMLERNVAIDGFCARAYKLKCLSAEWRHARSP